MCSASCPRRYPHRSRARQLTRPPPRVCTRLLPLRTTGTAESHPMLEGHHQVVIVRWLGLKAATWWTNFPPHECRATHLLLKSRCSHRRSHRRSHQHSHRWPFLHWSSSSSWVVSRNVGHGCIPVPVASTPSTQPQVQGVTKGCCRCSSCCLSLLWRRALWQQSGPQKTIAGCQITHCRTRQEAP